MSIFEYKLVDADCDICGKVLSDKVGQMTSIREVERTMEIFGWVKKDEKILCNECKNKLK